MIFPSNAKNCSHCDLQMPWFQCCYSSSRPSQSGDSGCCVQCLDLKHGCGKYMQTTPHDDHDGHHRQCDIFLEDMYIYIYMYSFYIEYLHMIYNMIYNLHAIIDNLNEPLSPRAPQALRFAQRAFDGLREANSGSTSECCP